ncbi:hypothetical protein HWV07_11480 [Natronomonas salina]|uniref:hypothetical protein n=1 Tax=Natronomonas salina TaxID=1710540 RepID=UPI0015B68DDB|nr:hypothetical protein [Natronomonas salina]QLD89616.1 hypothetical protein HWV07_11480 [Natronomonas salina]
MMGLLFQYAYSTVIVLLMSIGVFMIASTLHEGTHWIVGRIWSSELEILRLDIVFPVAVIFHSPYDLPPHGVRLTGVAPLLFWLPVAVTIYVALAAAPVGRVLLSVPFWAAAILSPSDVLAFLYPERFQEYAANGNAVGHIGMIKILLQELTS